MKILKRVDASTWKQQVKCSTCTSELEIDIKDVKSTYDQRDGTYYYIICPICDHHIYVTVPKELHFAL